MSNEKLIQKWNISDTSSTVTRFLHAGRHEKEGSGAIRTRPFRQKICNPIQETKPVPPTSTAAAFATES